MDNLDAGRFVVATSESVQLGVKSGRIDERDTPGFQHRQPLENRGAGRDDRDTARALLQPRDHLRLAIAADHGLRPDIRVWRQHPMRTAASQPSSLHRVCSAVIP